MSTYVVGGDETVYSKEDNLSRRTVMIQNLNSNEAAR